MGKGSGSVVEYLTRGGGVVGLSLTETFCKGHSAFEIQYKRNVHILLSIIVGMPMTAQPGAVPQQQWIAKPQGIPGCPPGLEYLRVHLFLYNCR